MTESSRGILTEADREFLWMDAEEQLEEYSRSAISQRRSTIRQRVYNSLGDLQILFDHLPDSDRKDAFATLQEGMIHRDRVQVLRRGVAFLLLGVIEQENVDLDDEDFYENTFYHVIETVLFKAGLGAEKIDVDVEVEGWSHPDEGLAGGDLNELSEEQLRRLLFAGHISSEDFAHGVLDKDD